MQIYRYNIIKNLSFGTRPKSTVLNSLFGFFIYFQQIFKEQRIKYLDPSKPISDKMKTISFVLYFFP